MRARTRPSNLPTVQTFHLIKINYDQMLISTKGLIKGDCEGLSNPANYAHSPCLFCKVLMKRSHIHLHTHCVYVYTLHGCFQSQPQSWHGRVKILYQRPYRLQSLKNLLSGLLQKTHSKSWSTPTFASYRA